MPLLPDSAEPDLLAPALEPELRQRLQRLESELGTLHAQLSRLAVGRALPGLYLVVEVGAHELLIPAAQVEEIARLVEQAPLPRAPEWVLGSFVYRGRAHLSVDLAALLGEARPLPLDAHMVVVASAVPAALVVDRVRSLAETPTLSSADRASAGVPAQVVAAICRVGERHLPLLALDQVLSRVAEVSP